VVAGRYEDCIEVDIDTPYYKRVCTWLEHKTQMGKNVKGISNTGTAGYGPDMSTCTKRKSTHMVK
jgi:hypothetical protein